MKGKITLITPPDFFETDTLSLLFMNTNEEDQDKISQWFFNSNINENINIYFCDRTSNVSWLLYANSRADYKFIDLDNRSIVLDNLSGYLLGKKNIFWQTKDKNIAEIFYHINQNRIISVEEFLKKVFDGQNGT